jgi:hypothetical protein
MLSEFVYAANAPVVDRSLFRVAVTVTSIVSIKLERQQSGDVFLNLVCEVDDGSAVVHAYFKDIAFLWQLLKVPPAYVCAAHPSAPLPP